MSDHGPRELYAFQETGAATTATHHILAFTSAPGLGETFDAFRNWYAEHCASLNADRDPLRFLILRSTDVSGKQGHAS